MRVWIYLLRKGAYRDISHIILKHTISNKLVIKVSAQKKGGGGGGGEVMTATNMCSNFGSKWSSLPIARSCLAHGQETGTFSTREDGSVG